MNRDPCKNCPDRTITCHHTGHCDRYQKLRERVDAVNKKRREENTIIAYTVRAVRQSHGRERWY